MKKGDVLQLSIIILALIIGINSLEYLIGSVIGLVYLLGMGEYGGNASSASPTIISILVTLLYMAICWQLLVKSKNLADFIYERTNMGTSFKIISRPNDLLYILFIVTGIYFMIQHLPALVKGLVTAFTNKASGRYSSPGFERPADWLTVFVRLLLPALLLMAARPMANYFAKNVQDEPVLIGDDIGNLDDNEITEP